MESLFVSWKLTNMWSIALSLIHTLRFLSVAALRVISRIWIPKAEERATLPTNLDEVWIRDRSFFLAFDDTDEDENSSSYNDDYEEEDDDDDGDDMEDDDCYYYYSDDEDDLSEDGSDDNDNESGTDSDAGDSGAENDKIFNDGENDTNDDNFHPCQVEAEAKGLDVSGDFTPGAAVAIIFIENHRLSPEHNGEYSGSRQDFLELILSFGRHNGNSSDNGGDDSGPEDYYN